jgi:hypothetical protein
MIKVGWSLILLMIFFLDGTFMSEQDRQERGKVATGNKNQKQKRRRKKEQTEGKRFKTKKAKLQMEKQNAESCVGPEGSRIKIMSVMNC